MAKRKRREEATAIVTWPEVSADDKPLYANGVLVSHTPWDFTLHFGQVIPPIGQTAARTEVKARQVAVISLPVTLVRGVITALETNLERYEERFGKIEIPKKETTASGNNSNR